MSKPRKRRAPNHIWRPAFLVAFAECGSVRKACQAAGIERQTFYQALKKDPAFVAQFEDAKQDAVDTLKEKAFEGATIGFQEAVIYQGEVTATVRRVHPSLLMFLLKSYCPEEFADRIREERSGPGGKPQEHHHTHWIDPELLSSEELELMQRVAERLEEGSDGPAT